MSIREKGMALGEKGLALEKRGMALEKRAWRGAIVKLARGNTRVWRPSWSCDQYRVIRFSFPCT